MLTGIIALIICGIAFVGCFITGVMGIEHCDQIHSYTEEFVWASGCIIISCFGFIFWMLTFIKLVR